MEHNVFNEICKIHYLRFKNNPKNPGKSSPERSHDLSAHRALQFYSKDPLKPEKAVQ